MQMTDYSEKIGGMFNDLTDEEEKKVLLMSHAVTVEILEEHLEELQETVEESKKRAEELLEEVNEEGDME